jgi:phosphoribosylaminoimidazole-succinocarboxamide synthase
MEKIQKIPENLRHDELTQFLLENEFKLINQGKVRNTWQLTKKRLLVVTTDRISIFDFVLNALIPKKGEILTAMTHFWLTKILSDFNHHLIKAGYHATANGAYDLRKIMLHGLPIERCLLVEDMSENLCPFEMIYRHHLGGSVYDKYLETNKAGGHELPPNLPQWAKLESPIFTPSTKEEIGHDINVDADYFFKEMDKNNLGTQARVATTMLEQAYKIAYAYAEKKGILILDTKFENAGPKIIDEVLTPDSSRYCRKADWEKAMEDGRSPNSLDKQFVRNWGMTIATPFGVTGINKLDPKNQEHINFVHSLKVPPEIAKETTKIYLKIFQSLTDQSLEEYQKKEMGV